MRHKQTHSHRNPLTLDSGPAFKMSALQSQPDITSVNDYRAALQVHSGQYLGGCGVKFIKGKLLNY